MRSSGFLAIALLAIGSLAQAQGPVAPQGYRAAASPPLAESRHTSLAVGELTPTPSMWFYEQERRQYEDPRSAVRANAEFRGAQRRQRMAAAQWYGFSNSRPIRSTTPTTNTSTPHWSSSTAAPYLWSEPGRPTMVFAPDTGAYVR